MRVTKSSGSESGHPKDQIHTIHFESIDVVVFEYKRNYAVQVKRFIKLRTVQHAFSVVFFVVGLVVAYPIHADMTGLVPTVHARLLDECLIHSAASPSQ